MTKTNAGEKATLGKRRLPLSVNYHINTHCNFACKFCFATFEDSKAELGGCMLKEQQQLAILDALVAAGAEKITFVGGEPTLIPWLPKLVERAKKSGVTTMIVTNGFRLEGELFEALAPNLDWIAFSVDSADVAINRASGRAAKKGGGVLPAAEMVRRAAIARNRGIRIKLNTVVHQLNCKEDMSDFVAAMKPERWKLFQVLPVKGQNDGSVESLLIERSQFDAYVERHRHVEACGVEVVPECNDAMRGSYAMVDPAGRFFDNTEGGHTYSKPILEVGVEAAFKEVSFDAQKFEARGALYDWANDGDSERSPLIAISGVSGAGKDSAGQILSEELGYVRVAIADPLKELVGVLFGLTEEQLWGAQRNEVVEELGRSPRKLYQELGSFCREIDPNVWLRIALRRIRELIGEGQRVVCTDVRTHEEFEALQAEGASVWHITRRGAGAPEELSADATEREAQELARREVGVVIDNDGTLEELREKVLNAARSISPASAAIGT
ncbi:viperin family antiviral radical SAM protein [Lujinxingia vulgaris]|uniref:viperin family antiviral radical SAM protein n=1 Tax=Lujinxingia vulgaris TaxID=2600176 RepID=UPI001E5329BF|nr:viperin family antiviral radical SAM protein [Lujinxingia vulgaris]